MKIKKLLLAVTAIVAFAMNATAQTIPSYIPANGLVGYWPFNGNANDESGNGNHGTVNGATLTTDRNGLLNKSFEFNGNNITVAHNNSLNISNSFSVCFWYLSNSNYFAQDLLMKGPDNVPNIWLIRQHTYSINPNVDFAFKTNSNVGVGMGFPYPPINTWSFVVATVENNILRIFQNGVLKNSLSNVSIPSVINNNYNLTIGTLQYSFSGKIDDIAIYNRALTQQEITALYTGNPPCTPTSSNFNLTIPSTNLPFTWNGLIFNASGSQTKHLTNVGGCDSAATLNLTVINTALPSYLPANGLVAWYPFNGNANDESGNGNNGTVFGATLTSDRNGNANKAYSFNGISNNISFNLNSMGNTIPTNTEFTTSVWVKTSDNNGPLISMQGVGGFEYDLHIGTLSDVVQSSGNYGILVRDNCCGTGNNIFGGSVVDNIYHMLTIVRLSNGTLKLYKDGLLEAVSASGQSGTLTFSPLSMAFGADLAWAPGGSGCGSCNTIDQQHLIGTLDDICIWNRALSQTEITALYNSSQNTINLNLTTFLEGSYSGNSSMAATPNKLNASIPNTIADTITVELHANSSPYATIYSSNGVLNTNGTAIIAFPNSAIGSSYYIAIKHRNAIETWSAAPVTISNHTIYNFTTAASQAFGNNLSNMGDGVFGIYSGDINQDGSIDFSDYPDLDIANNSGVLGYNVNDLNGDASVDFNDYPILDINSNNGIIAMRP